MAIYSANGGGIWVRDPQEEPRDRTRNNQNTVATVDNTWVNVTMSCEAIHNNWARVERWLWTRLPTNQVIPPCPACDTFTITLEYSSIETAIYYTDKHRRKFERIVNSYPLRKTR